MTTRSEDLTIPADDGAPLAATLVSPAAGAARGPLTVIASATGVPRRYYARFAQFLANHGRPTLTFDYRGIGGSLHEPIAQSKARFRDWGIIDTPGILAWAAEHTNGAPIHWVGHSYGGFAPGLAHNGQLVSRMLGVATMTADIRLMPSPLERLRVRALIGLAAPMVARVKGYVPGWLNGNSEDLPKGVALEWAKWVQTPGFLFGDATVPEKRYFARVTAPMMFAYMEDDAWVTERGVRHLARQFSGSIDQSFWRVTLAEAKAERIGHVGFFRAPFAATLWPAALTWLDG
jgi:predicted alpha/beta hydrolase